MAALLTLDKDNTDKIVKYVVELENMDIELLPPNINRSDLVFKADQIGGKEVILFGLSAIKGVGEIAVRSIIKAREEEAFHSISDFLSRIDSSKVNKKVLESIIKAGALDELGHTRHAMLEQIEILVEGAYKASQAKKMIEGSLFGESDEIGVISIEIQEMSEYDLKYILEMEKETLGFYVSGHPLDDYREELEGIEYNFSTEVDELAHGSQALFIGKVEEIVEKMSKKGNKFAIVKLLDYHGSMEFMIYEDKLSELKEDFDLLKPIAFKVKIKKKKIKPVLMF